VNTNRWDAMKRTDCAVIGDALASIEAIDAAVGDYRADETWLAGARGHVQDWAGYLQGVQDRSDLDPPSYGQVIRACNELAPARGLRGERCGRHHRRVDHGLEQPVAELLRRGVGLLDHGIRGLRSMGASMAVAQSRRARGGEVLAFMGDGSYLMGNSDVFVRSSPATR
jgi:3D-(3,5/4)-trihydroxycyclohexane-1,2-dione acylhydrolase (decyclizing)